jgi:hypothetical protein
MLKSVIIALALGSSAVTGFYGTAQAARWECALPIGKGGCASPIYQPVQQPANPKG